MEKIDVVTRVKNHLMAHNPSTFMVKIDSGVAYLAFVFHWENVNIMAGKM